MALLTLPSPDLRVVEPQRSLVISIIEHREDLEQELVRNHRHRRTLIDQRSNHRHRRHRLLDPW